MSSNSGRETQSAKDIEEVVPRVKPGEPEIIGARAVAMDKKGRALARLGPRGNIVSVEVSDEVQNFDYTFRTLAFSNFGFSSDFDIRASNLLSMRAWTRR